MAIRSYQGKTPQVPASAFVDEFALVQGQVSLGEDVSVWPMASIRGDVQAITIGDQTNIQDNCTLHVTHAGQFNPNGRALAIGKQVTVGHQVVLHACTIGDRCLIGMGSIVLDDAIVETQTLLGAGSLVAQGQRLDGGYLWLGRPAKKIRPLTNEECDFLTYSAQHYVKLKNQHS